MHGFSSLRQLFADLTAGLAVAALVAWAVATVFHLPPVVALCAAAAAFLRIFASLRRLRAEPCFALAPFCPAALEFEPERVSADERPKAAEPGERADAADELRSAIRNLRRAIG